MFRDKSSLVNIGYGLTSRDVPESNREESVSNPNSGFIARILDDKPIIKFVSVTAATMAGTYASNKLLAKGGIRLAQFAQGKADSGSRLGRRFVEKASQIKKTLDELEGLNRFVADGVDPYEKLINRSADGKIIKPTLTKLTGDSYVSDGARWMTSSEYRSLRSGREPVAVWDYKDEIQQRLVRSARSLPLTLPSAYFVQKGVTDRFKGQDQNNKVNWYNPVDVITDFVKQSTLNITTMILPQNIAGAGLKRIKSLTDSQYLDYDFPLTPMQKKTANSFSDIKTILKSFGQDSEKLLSQASRISASAGYAFRTGLQEQQSRAGGGLVFALRDARRGKAAAEAASRASAEGKLKKASKAAAAYIFGYNDASRSYRTIGAVDGIPGIRGLAVGARTFTRNFFGGKRAYDVVHGAMSYDEALRATSSNPTEARRVLSTAISEIKSQRKSRISGFSQASLRSNNNLSFDGANEPNTQDNFGFAFQADTYGRAVQDKLINLGADPTSAKNMVSGLKIKGVNTTKNISERITLGISRIDSTSDDDEDFFRILVDRANKELKNKGRKLDVAQTKEAFGYADALFQSDDFRQSLVTRSNILYQSVKNEVIVPSASALVKPQKALFSEFTGDLAPNKVDYLARTVAKKLGIKLVDYALGGGSSEAGISRELAKRGIDPNNVQQLRSFLVDEKLMTRPSDVGGFNIFGLRQVTVDKAFDAGVFSGLSSADQAGTRSLFSDIAQQDPVSRTVGFSTVRGVFESTSGNIIDTTGITDSSKKLLRTLTQDLGVPIVKFNPLQMLGVGGPRKVDSNQEIQFVPGISRQDFLAGGGENASVFAWVKEKGGLFGSIGKLFSVSEQADTPDVKQLPGLFKAISSIDTDIYARATRLATGRQSYRDSELTAMETGENLSRGERVKSLFDVDEEQPNSIVQRIGRFLGRKTDIRNEPTISTLIQKGEIVLKGGKRLTLSNGADGLPSVIDESGSVVYTPDEVSEAYENFRISAQGKGTDLRSMAAIEDGMDIDPALRVSGLVGSELSAAGDKALETFKDLRSSLVAGGTNVTGLSRSARNLERVLRESEATATFISTNKSTTITTRQEYLRNLIHRFNVESATYKAEQGDPVYAAKKLEEILRGLKDSGEISSSQLAEARAAAAGTVLNLSAMRAYVEGDQRGRIASNSLKYLMEKRSSDTEFAKSFGSLLSPFSSQSISNVNAQGAGRYLNSIRPMLKKNLGYSPYELGPNAVNVLGNMGTTFVPTFNTVLDRAARGEVSFTGVAKNILGLSSYEDPDTYSAASIPSIHLSERLNKQFESVGLGLQHENYKGPIQAFAGGYGIKRVLPIIAGGTALMTADRTIGGYTNDKDDRGERVYSPFFTTKIARGAVEVQSAISGVVPGGMNSAEKREQLMEGEVPVKQGRYWPLGVTPFEGGKTMYYRPSYYRKLASGTTYTSDAFKSPLERLAYGYDFSPLRPLDPYRFERQHYFDRPYPVSGEYFTGGLGPITPALNMTVGKILKPQVKMHSEEVSNALSSYLPAGYSGAYDPSGLMSSGSVTPLTRAAISGFGSSNQGMLESSQVVGLQMGSYNNQLATNVQPLNTARNLSYDSLALANSAYVNSSNNNTIMSNQQPSSFAGMYGPPPVAGYIPPSIVNASSPISQSGTKFQLSEFGYRTQEMAGLYGFGFANARQSLGFGKSDFEPQAPVLQSASKGYGMGRSFWDLNLGGLGDVPSSEVGLELSEITRRFIPKERTDINYLNPIVNTMGIKHPFLPGADYFTNFKTGDPFTKIQEGELRLPGVAYERLNPTRKNYNDPINQLNILSDVAPYSREYRSLDRTLNMGALEPSERVEVERIRSQTSEISKRNNFTPYKYKNKTTEEIGAGQLGASMLKMGEYMAHRDTFINTKFFPNRTAQEDYERRHVYGATFPEWQRPIESFIKPAYNKSTQRNPVAAGLITAGVGSMFARTPGTRAIAASVGFTTGLAYSASAKANEAVTGQRFIPKERKKQLALEEYTDMLSYVKNTALSSKAAESGDMAAAAQFSQSAKRTMYGADIFEQSLDTLSLSVPKRKREHFREMIQEENPEERERILSTSPRLERRIYQAAWGMKVEEKPDLVEYFSRHELPDLGWEGWHPNTNMEHVKVKLGQSMGINMAQMGYFPQQIREANSTNPSYPGFSSKEDPRMVAAKLRMIMSRNGISGSVYPVANAGSSSSISISSGIM